LENADNAEKADFRRLIKKGTQSCTEDHRATQRGKRKIKWFNWISGGYKPSGFVNPDEDGRKLTKLDDFLRQ
jgi:hypothetical protein